MQQLPGTTSRPRGARAARVTAASSKQSKATEPKQKLYIGFAKDDTQPREGRQGRFISDNPKKYPQRTELVGGWAGGELGLKQFVEEYNRAKANPPPSSQLKLGRDPKPISRGADPIYLGFGKTDIEDRRAGAKGRVIKDDARKYPQRDAVVGGFAGGELGVKTFVEVGDVPLAESAKRRRQQSPLIVAGLVSLAATIGGLLLTEAGEVVQGALGL